MKVAAIQHDIAFKDAAGTFELVGPLVDEAVAQGARLIVLTEMYATGFTMDADAIVEPPDGPAQRFLRDRARDHGVWMAASVAVDDGGVRRNRFCAFGPGGEAVFYDKRHPFTYAGEHEVFSSGDEFVTFTVDGLRITPFVCYDLRFGDEFWRLGPDTDLFVVVANWPEKRSAHWSTLLAARAIENQCWVVGVNRVGEAEGLVYSGDSAIIDPFGNVVAGASGRSAVLVADVTVEEVERIRSHFPFLADRR